MLRVLSWGLADGPLQQVLFEPLKQLHHDDQDENHEKEAAPGVVVQAELGILLSPACLHASPQQAHAALAMGTVLPGREAAEPFGRQRKTHGQRASFLARTSFIKGLKKESAARRGALSASTGNGHLFRRHKKIPCKMQSLHLTRASGEDLLHRPNVPHLRSCLRKWKKNIVTKATRLRHGCHVKGFEWVCQAKEKSPRTGFSTCGKEFFYSKGRSALPTGQRLDGAAQDCYNAGQSGKIRR